MPRKVSLEQARAKGLKRYFTGKPCKRGHIAERYTAISACCLCMKDCRRLAKIEQRVARSVLINFAKTGEFQRCPTTPEPEHLVRISRDEARAKGLTNYFTGEPCKNNHIAKRNVRWKHCLDCSAGKKRRRYRTNLSHRAKQDRRVAVIHREGRIAAQLLKQFAETGQL